ncbi:MAG: hypothetical protein AAB456_00585 [Patescibacteria group bacterium]
MKLYATITDSHGKREGRGDNDYLEIMLNERNENRFLIAFNGDKIMVLCYGNGERITLSYAEGKTKGISQHDPRTCENSVPCYDCMEIERPQEYKELWP